MGIFFSSLEVFRIEIAPHAPPTVLERLSILNAEIELAKIRHSNLMLWANMDDDEDYYSEN